MIGRERELQVVLSLLERGRAEPAVLVLDGQAGIGKTTLCRAACEEAAQAGFTVLKTSGAASEVSLAWAGLADLILNVDEPVLTELSPQHQHALQAVSAGQSGPGVDERLVASAFRAALERQSRLRPVLIAVDDAQWLDDSSRLALGFAVRRLSGPVAVLAASRDSEASAAGRSWIQPADPQALTRLTLGPLCAGSLREVIEARLGRTPPWPTMERIHALSGGNPLYAIELAHAVAEDPDGGLESISPTLTGLVRERIGELEGTAAEALIMVAAAFAPTVDMIATATGRSPAEIIEILQPIESRGVLVFDGCAIRLTHPLIASAITSGAEPAQLRRAHRRLAETVEHPESRARHLTLSSPHGDLTTLAALDVAAEHAAAQGAYSTAAELFRLAVRRGGDTHWRRLRGADFHFRAGALDDAEALVLPIVEDLTSGFLRTVGLLLVAAIRGYRDGLANSTCLLERAVNEAGDDLALRTQALLALTLAVGAAGGKGTCVELARRARADADATGMPELRSQALALWVYLGFQYGLGIDSEALRTALEIEDPEIIAPTTALQPSAVYAATSAWAGRLEEARRAMTNVLHRCEERGTELDMLWAAEQLTWVEVALGNYAEAERIAADALHRARQIGGQLPLITAHTAAANVAAHLGRIDETRAAAGFAFEAATTGKMYYLARPTLMSLAFVQVSDGQYAESLQTLQPLLEAFEADHDTEIVVGAYLPDAVEALTATGRIEEAEPLVAALETNGLRQDRPWMLAVGARCRALVLAARGDLDSAVRAAEQAMNHHDRLPMPFERARSQLLVGQLQRRRRRTAAARENLGAAAVAFEEIGSPLWHGRAQREVARLTIRSASSVLSDSERQVAERAAAGQTNKQIAAGLFLSAKTVEMQLSSAYRKLGIRSRVQLVESLRTSAD